MIIRVTALYLVLLTSLSSYGKPEKISSIYRVIHKQNLKELEDYLKRGGDPFKVGKESLTNKTPIDALVNSGKSKSERHKKFQMEALKMLDKYKVNLQRASGSNFILASFARAGNLELVKTLMETGQDPIQSNNSLQTAYGQALTKALIARKKASKWYGKGLEKLKQKKSPIEKTIQYLLMPIYIKDHMIRVHPNEFSGIISHLSDTEVNQIAKLNIKYNQLSEEKRNAAFSLLKGLEYTKDISLIKTTLDRFIRLDLSIDQADDTGTTPVMLAALHGQLDLVKYFIDKKVSLKKKTLSGWNVADFAVSAKQAPVIKYLARQGIRPKKKHFGNDSPNEFLDYIPGEPELKISVALDRGYIGRGGKTVVDKEKKLIVNIFSIDLKKGTKLKDLNQIVKMYGLKIRHFSPGNRRITVYCSKCKTFSKYKKLAEKLKKQKAILLVSPGNSSLRSRR